MTNEEKESRDERGEMTEEKNKEAFSEIYRILFERRHKEKSRKFDSVLDFFLTFAFYYRRPHLYFKLFCFCNFGNFCCLWTNKAFLPLISVINSVYLFALIIIIIPILYYIDQNKIILINLILFPSLLLQLPRFFPTSSFACQSMFCYMIIMLWFLSFLLLF